MSTAELIEQLQKVNPSDLRAELSAKREARDEMLARYEQEMELIERLIDVVDHPRRESITLTQLAKEVGVDASELPGMPEPGDMMAILGYVAPESVAIPTAITKYATPQRVVPDPKPKRLNGQALQKKTAELTVTPYPQQIATYLEAMGRMASGAIARHLKLDRGVAEEMLEKSPQFAQDKDGFWDLKARVEERENPGAR